MSIKKTAALLLVALVVMTAGRVEVSLGEHALSSDQMAVLYGGANNGLCCDVAAECKGGLGSCTGRDPCEGQEDVYNTSASFFCGLPPTPPNPLANCGQYVTDPLGNRPACYWKRWCQPNLLYGCVSGQLVEGSVTPGVWSCAHNKACGTAQVP